MQNKIAYLFDVDGVLSDPVKKQVTETELFRQIMILLQNGNPVCINTGRSTEWMVERVITPFLERITDKAILDIFIAIGEKGGTWINFDKEGNMHHGKMNDIAIPEEVLKETEDLVNHAYHDSMFFDDTKETMMSIEMHDGFNIDTFHKKREVFLNDLKKLLEQKGLTEKFKIDPSNISTDVESPIAGKNLGAEHFLQFLEEKKSNPVEFETFGDSKSDFEMSDELERKGKSVKMIYVGDKSLLGEFKRNYPIEYIGGFTQGTLEYLRSH